jgi:outer membrane protein OmpA-like peptidoglycan-associated protein
VWWRKSVAGGLAVLLPVLLSGCANTRAMRPVDCRVATALAMGAAGAATGAVAEKEIDSSPNGIAIASGGVVGFVVGGVAGYALGHWTCPSEEAPAAPAPPPAPPPPAPVHEKLVLRGVAFDFDKAAVRADARPVLDEAVSVLAARPTVRVAVEGHTDGVGSDAYNQRLSERRARAVLDYLVRAGVASDRLEAQGFGKSRPVADNATADGRARNRRVELRILSE